MLDSNHTKVDLKSLDIFNKKGLFDYMHNDFSLLFFTKGRFAQEKLRVVGPIRLRTVHTKNKSCTIDTGVNDCYHANMHNDKDIVKEDIDGVKFQTCDQNGISHTIIGE